MATPYIGKFSVLLRLKDAEKPETLNGSGLRLSLWVAIDYAVVGAQ